MNKSPLFSTLALALGFSTAPAAAQTGVQGFPQHLVSQVEALRAQLQAEGRTFQVGVNPAMQYPVEELCGLRPELRQLDFEAHAEGGCLNPQFEELPTAGLPAQFTGWFSSVKDQGKCGSCWAFATIGNLEGAALKKHGAPQGRVNANGSITPSGDITVLSEQQVLSCNPDGYGCNGGWFSYDMLMPSKAAQGSGYYRGAVPASVFPYVAQRVACTFDTNTTYTPVNQWGYVGNGYGIPSVEAIKAAIFRYGSVSAGVYVDQAFQAYRGGVYTGRAGGRINHAILLVGWDNAKGAWLLKNSWTSGWGVNGFMWIKYGANSVGTSPAWVVD